MKTFVWRIDRNASNALVLPPYSIIVLIASLLLLTACKRQISRNEQMLVPATSGPVKIGEEITRTFETQHPYEPTAVATEPTWNDTLTFEGAEFIALHFSRFELAAGDYVIVRSPDGKQSFRFDSHNNPTEVAAETEFWSLPVYGTSAIVELFSTSRSSAYGYMIDKFFHGFNVEDLKNTDRMQRTDCGYQNAVEPICLQSENPAVYESSRAVVRIFNPINASTCSGFLIGSEGHVLTTNRCVPDSATASNLWVEFMGESDDCESLCRDKAICPSDIKARTATLVKTNASLDYSLLKLPRNFSDDYGYLKLRVPGPKLGEQIYIPHYVYWAGKRIALLSNRHEAEVPSRITSTEVGNCRWVNNVHTTDASYFANLNFGSEGAPVLSYQDHHVIALNHCDPSWCPNQGIKSYDLALDLGADLPADALYNQPSIPVEVTLKRIKIVDDAPIGGAENPPENTLTRVFLGVNGQYRGFPSNGNGMFPRGEWVDVPAEAFTYYQSLASDDLLEIHLHTYLPRIVSWHPQTGEPIFGPERHLQVRNEFSKDDRVPGDFQMNPGFFAAGNHTVRSDDNSGFFEAEYSIRIRQELNQ